VVRGKSLPLDVHAWTVDESNLIDRLTGLEVTGITTNDPRLFARPAAVSG
jgi:glycerophosphoryl diester phosphodiesterase